MARIELAVDTHDAKPSHAVTTGYPTMGAVLCGGQSRRFGSDKAVATMPDGRPLGLVAVGAMRGAGIDPVVAIGGSFSSELGIPTVGDRWPGEGPLGGVATALLYATQGHVLVTPCDLVSLSSDHLEFLTSRNDPNVAVVASVDGVARPSLGLWPTAWARSLVAEIRSGARRLDHLLSVGDYELVDVPSGALDDADTKEELANKAFEG